MDSKRLTEIEERCEKATPGPWKNKHFDSAIGDTGDCDHCDRITASDGSPSPVYVHDEWGGRSNSCEDSVFIAASRTDLPDLVAAYKLLRADAAELARVMNDSAYADCDCDEPHCMKARELLSRPSVVNLLKEKDGNNE